MNRKRTTISKAIDRKKPTNNAGASEGVIELATSCVEDNDDPNYDRMDDNDPFAISAEPEEPVITLAYVRERAIRLLARREHTVRELHHKLSTRDLPTDLIETALDELCAENLLSNARFAEIYVRRQYERQRGPVKIRAALRERGVDDHDIRQAFADEFDWFDGAARARHKRFGCAAPADFAARAKQMRFLQARGFGHDHIQYAISVIEEI